MADREWLELGHATIGDIAYFRYTALAGEGGVELDFYKTILAWIARMKSLPGFMPMPGLQRSGR